MLPRLKGLVVGLILTVTAAGATYWFRGKDQRTLRKAFAAEERSLSGELSASTTVKDTHKIHSKAAYQAELKRLKSKGTSFSDDPEIIARRIHLAVGFDPDQAILECRELLAQYPGNTFALNHLAAAYYQKGQSAKALQYAARSLDQQPHPNTCNLIARLFLQQQRPAKAREYFEAALELDEHHAESRNALHKLMLQGH